MSAAFGVGLVVGKFAPLHKGHVLVAEHAASLCRRVVVISYSSPELPGYEAERRETWLKACFPNATVLVVTPERLAEWLGGRGVPAIPPKHAPGVHHRELLTMLCQPRPGSHGDAGVTREGYGDGVAADPP